MSLLKPKFNLVNRTCKFLYHNSNCTMFIVLILKRLSSSCSNQSYPQRCILQWQQWGSCSYRAQWSFRLLLLSRRLVLLSAWSINIQHKGSNIRTNIYTTTEDASLWYTELNWNRSNPKLLWNVKIYRIYSKLIFIRVKNPSLSL